GDPILDDVKVRGRVAVRATRHVTSLAADQVLSFGQRLDFDRGVVLESDDGEGDLTWDVVPQPAALAMPRELPESYDADPLGEAPVEQPARALSTIVARGGARMTLVTNASFESLSELDLERLPYLESLSSIASIWLPVSDAGMPENAAVIAVRTGEGRYAKAAAWRDSAGRLHLRYRTFASAEPLTIAAAWRTNRGAERARAAGMLAYADHDVARAGTFRASGPALREPASYEWFWNGEPLDENGISADGVTLRASGSDAHITTEGGVAVRGELAVRVVDATGATYEAFRDVAVAGTERVWETASYAETAAVPAIAIAEEPRMVMVPLVEQLRFAIAAGFDSEAAAIELQ
ncbi:MAG TPA: hypothetical protein VHK90_06360, partial [Thermoanaerobaculia bacterium]|nr:hypothetical protein [Thermoanaerobaculia bacterium]